MKVNIIKSHPHYPLGDAEVTPERGNYLIGIGVAEAVKEKKEAKVEKEKVEHEPTKEKKEIAKPTTKKK